VDPGKNPKHIDVTPLDGSSKDKTVQGIYKLEKGRLFLCIREEKHAGKGRPREFVADEQEGLGLGVLERVRDRDKPAADKEKN
jgi:hypothetical protein